MKRQLAAAALGANLILAQTSPALSQTENSAQTGRTISDLSHGWRFHFESLPTPPISATFDDSDWSQVSVPHSWNRIGEYSLARSGKTDNRQGTGWYRLSFNAPASSKRRRQYLDFAAVSNVADIWVNGQHVGQHKGAFSRFRFDVTQFWKPGATNLIVVKADNSAREPDSTTSQTLPLSGDFFLYGGIYRGVSLITTDDVGIDLLDHGGPGIYAHARDIETASAQIDVTTRLRNQGERPRKLQLSLQVRDASGQVISRKDSRIRLTKGATELQSSLAVINPHLWNGTADPYLYSITAELRDASRVIDRVTEPLGIRSVSVDPNRGFYLNGKQLSLHGVSRHQDSSDKGWALTASDHAKDMDLVVEIGANTIRQAHYQHADEWSELADKRGIIVWAELPYVTTPTLTGGVGSPELWANAKQQLQELIRQNYNHPSIAMWSVGNEVDSAKGFGVGGKEPPKPLALLEQLNTIAKQEDPFRPTAFADCCEDLGMVKTAGEKLAGTTDLIGYNRYYGWYYPEPLQAQDQLGTELDRLHKKHPEIPLSLSEYGAGGATSQHSDNIEAGFVNFIGRPHPEEFQAWVLEQNWKAIQPRKFIFASWVWNMFDFGSDMRNEGDTVDLNDKGLVTFDRATRKDAYYFFQSRWSKAPMIHLTGKRYSDRAYSIMDVKAYTNGDRATLSINGKELGETPCAEGVCIWPNVSLAPGPNLAKVTSDIDGKQVTDSMSWIGPDPMQGIRIDTGDQATRILAGHRFGSDNFVSGGKPRVLNMGSFGKMRAAPPKAVTAPIPELYDFWREGEKFSYSIPVPNGSWKVIIHSFEPKASTSVATKMTVKANGKDALASVDVAKAAGGPMKGVALSFPTEITDGRLHLDFTAVGGNAVVAAIEVTR